MSATDQVRQDVRRTVRAALQRQRQQTLRLLAPLTRPEVHDQYHDFLSPIIWDVGHVGNFEELWLLRKVDGRHAHDPSLDALYNAFENPRWKRGDLPILPAEQALPYLEQVRDEALGLLDKVDVHPSADGVAADGAVHRMITQHESQHQETILQSLDLRDEVSAWDLGRIPPDQRVDDLARVHVPAGPFVLGTDATRWTYDNERPGHVVDLEAFLIDRHPVTNRRWARFVEDRGYERPELFSEAGRAWLAETPVTAPQGWQRTTDGWRVRRFGRMLDLAPAEPVQHVSFFEAEAFAAWAGGHLPTEMQWEKAASWDPAKQRKRRFPWGDAEPTAATANVGLTRFGPTNVGTHPAGASAYGAHEMAGDVYEWTTSSFVGWPGFQAHPYPEYSEVFFGQDHRVLRSSSWAIAPHMARCTYRNWDHPYRRQIFAGLRLTWPVDHARSATEDA